MAGRRVISFGEILFDVFESGAFLGGAPLNLAVHLHRLGMDVAMISAVGRDELGATACAAVAELGMTTEYIASTAYPTGQVRITLDAGKVPHYDFAADCAYDHIGYPENLDPDADLFCFGSLAQRAPESRATLYKLLSEFSGVVFFDVNLRQDFYSRPILEASLAAADIVKLNEDELPVLSQMFGIPGSPADFAARFKLATVILTLGPLGCEVYHRGETVIEPAVEADVVSTVGAGDAFSAGFLHRLLAGADAREAARAGNLRAAHVAGMTGAF